MNEYYKILDIQYDKNKLIEEHKKVSFKPFSTEKKFGGWFDYAPTWMQGKIVNDELIRYPEISRLRDYFCNQLVTKDIRPRFYKQEANTSVPIHNDVNTTCCINIILSDTFAPIVFEDIGAVHYSCALLNVTKRHEVPKFKSERLLLKFSMFDVSYEEAYDIL